MSRKMLYILQFDDFVSDQSLEGGVRPRRICCPIFYQYFGNILGLEAYFSKPIFALKPWVRTGRFEYHEPYTPNDFFFHL